MSTKSPIRVLSIDDSAFFCKVLTDIMGRDEEIDLVGCATDVYEARQQLLSTPIDVLTLDLELPRMHGLTFLKLLMDRKPMPVIVLSSLTPTGSPMAVEAITSGAFAVLQKPRDLSHKKSFGEKLLHGLKIAAAAAPLTPRGTGLHNPSFQTNPFPISTFDPRQIIALGASTGGTQALQEVLTALPGNLPGIVVVEHIPAGFSASFAARLNQTCAMEVREAKDGDIVHPGLALVAPGDEHMEVDWKRDHYQVRLHHGPMVEHQRPSVDVLFHSLAACAGKHTIAALLTGMGRDGAAGMKRLHDLHAYTLAQDARTSVVYGMARKAVELKAVDSIVSLGSIASEIVKALEPHNDPTPLKQYA